MTTAREKKEAIRGYVNKLKFKTPCKHCGESDPYCLTFHHKDMSQKTNTIGVLIAKRHTLSRVKREINKCVILCYTCHRKVHGLQQVRFGKESRQWERIHEK